VISVSVGCSQGLREIEIERSEAKTAQSLSIVLMCAIYQE